MVEPAQRLAQRLRADATWATVLGAIGANGPTVYVVGGTVRDLLLGRKSNDFDLAIDGPAIPFARRLADALGAAFYPMDTERDVARVLLGPPSDGRHVDVAGLRAKGILADLRARDFTVNAIALLPGDEAVLLDPTGGLNDLEACMLRMAAPHAFVDDPLRTLRLARLRTLLSFDVDDETEQAACWAAPRLASVTAERVRDELLALLALPTAVDGLAYAIELGLLTTLLPVPACSLMVALPVMHRVIEWQEAVLAGQGPRALAPFAEQLAAHWREPLAMNRSRGLILRTALLASLCGSMPAARALIGDLCLSRREAQHATGALQGAMMLRAHPSCNDVAIHRYFRRLRAAGVDGAVLALAEDSAGRAALAARAALEGWFLRHQQVVAPPSLIDGEAVIKHLGVNPGPLVGRLLDAVREAQVAGMVTTEAQALRFAASVLAPTDAQATTGKGDV